MKSAVNHVHRYEDSLADMARKHNCDGMICGHIHVAADRMINGIHYLNSGDWVESSTAIIEDLRGQMQVLDYKIFLRNLSLIKEQATIGISQSIKRKNFNIARSSASLF